MRLKTLLQQALHTANMYLPLVILAVLAMGSWWLARNTPSVAVEAVATPPKHEPDYLLTRFVTHAFDKDGKHTSELRGAKARHFPDTDVLEIDDVSIRTLKDNRLVTSTAKRAYSNGDGSEVQLVGNVVVVRQAQPSTAGSPEAERLEFRGEFLHAFEHTQQLKSHKPVVMIRGHNQFAASNLFYDHVHGIAEMSGRVKATFAPKP